MYELTVHNDATGDLRAILQRDRPAGLRLLKLISELKDDQDLLDRLSQVSYGGSPAHPRPKNATFNTGFWIAAQNKGMNLWRMRYFKEEVLGYRLLYAFLPASDTYVLLAVVEKADFKAENDERFNYELRHEISVRVFRAYDELLEFQ